MKLSQDPRVKPEDDSSGSGDNPKRELALGLDPRITGND